jgi:hypothetical protein
MTTQGAKRPRIDIPVAKEEKLEVEYLAKQRFISTGYMVKILVLKGIELWTKEGK